MTGGKHTREATQRTKWRKKNNKTKQNKMLNCYRVHLFRVLRKNTGEVLIPLTQVIITKFACFRIRQTLTKYIGTGQRAREREDTRRIGVDSTRLEEGLR